MGIQYRFAASKLEFYNKYDIDNREISTVECETNLGLSNPQSYIILFGNRFILKNEQNEIILDFQVASIFDIEQESWNEMLENNKLIIPKMFFTDLFFNNVATSRGVLLAKEEKEDYPLFLPPITIPEVNDITLEFVE